MKSLFAFAIFAALLLCPLNSQALEPGIYTVVNRTVIPLKFSNGVSSIEGKNLSGLEISYQTYRFKGETSGTEASDTFLLAIDPKQSEVVKKLKEYDPFVKSMKPSKLIFVRVKVDTLMHFREYYPGMKLDGMNIHSRVEMEFDWEKYADNVYRLIVYDLRPGEYAIFFKHTPIYGPDFTSMFGFTVPRNHKRRIK